MSVEPPHRLTRSASDEGAERSGEHRPEKSGSRDPEPAHARLRNGSVRLYTGLTALLVVLLFLVGASLLTLSSLDNANRASHRTYEVLVASERLVESLSRTETGFRGFALRGDPRILDSWRRGQIDFTTRAFELVRLTAGDPDQQRRLRTIVALQRRWVASQEQTGIRNAVSAMDQARVRRAASDSTGVHSRMRIRSDLNRHIFDLQAAERARLRRRSARALDLQRTTTALFGAGGALAVLLTALLAWLVHSRTRHVISATRTLEEEIAERTRATREIQRLSRQNQLVLEFAGEGIYGVDVDGYTTFLNPAAARMLGYATQDLVGRPMEAVLQQESATGERARQSDPIHETLRTATPHHVGDATFRRADGARFPVEYSATPIIEEGRTEGAVVIFRDVTERREVDRVKDEFVSIVSHELRTPLTAIRGSLGLLSSGQLGPFPERGQRLLEIAVQNTDRLVRLINDILDIERMGSGKAVLELHSTDAAEVVRSAVEMMEAMAEGAGVELVVEVDPTPLRADPDRILQVLSNLISNAIKFSPAGGVIRLTAVRVEEEVLFSVRDQGRGIPTDQLETIFERFQQVDSSDARQKGGTGLGLPISRSIVAQHGGRMWAESLPGEGSTFVFTLPVGGETTAATRAAAPSGPLVMLFDPDDDSRAAVGRMLHQWGYRVCTPGTAADAGAMARAERPEAVIVALSPSDGGSDFVAELGKDPFTRDVPVLMLATGLVTSPDASGGASGRRNGAVDSGSLLQALEASVAREHAPGKVLLIEDDPDLARVLREMFERHGIETLHARTGREAVEISSRMAPNMLILDLVLPDGDGYWVVDWLRRHDSLRVVPLVVYSAQDLDAAERERLRLGATEFLTKGRVSPEEFERRVVRLLNQLIPNRIRQGNDAAEAHPGS